MSDEDFMRRAIELSRDCLERNLGRPFGTVIVKEGEIIAEGQNRALETRDPTWHAELDAIRQASRVLGTADLQGCTLYASSEPCPMCTGAIHLANLDRVVFGASADLEGRWKHHRYPLTPDQLALPWLERRMPASQVLAAEARSVMTQE